MWFKICIVLLVKIADVGHKAAKLVSKVPLNREIHLGVLRKKA